MTISRMANPTAVSTTLDITLQSVFISGISFLAIVVPSAVVAHASTVRPGSRGEKCPNRPQALNFYRTGSPELSPNFAGCGMSFRLPTWEADPHATERCAPDHGPGQGPRADQLRPLHLDAGGGRQRARLVTPHATVD